MQPLPSRMPAGAHMAPQQLRDPHSRPWTQRGPPDEHSCSHPTFSWFYVPLLLAATNRLEPQAAEAWHQTPAAGNPWRRLVEHLQQARPVPWQQLLHVLTTLQQLATHTGQTLAESEAALPNRLREAGACQPPGTLVHLPWAVTVFQQPSGYIPATAQEALLHTFLGEDWHQQLPPWPNSSDHNLNNARPTTTHSPQPGFNNTQPHQASSRYPAIGPGGPKPRRARLFQCQ